MTKDELYEEVGNDKGLTESEAEKLLMQYGYNQLEEKGKKKPWQIFAGQFADLLVVILIIAAVISAVSGNTESTIVIFAVIILNAILGTLQYVKAERSLDSLKELSVPKAKVYRDGSIKEILSKDVCPGDVLLLEAGDMVVADCRIIENYSICVNEGSLTGESANVEKKDTVIEENVALADRYNMLYSGSLVTYGRARALVVATGMDTEIGIIAALMNDTKNKKTPLQISLDNFSKKLAILIMVISTIVFIMRIWQNDTVLDSLIFAVALAVAAIPEALSSIVTIVQAVGTRKMAADNAIIKDLKAVESLGCVSVICSDKTGTLTQNKMTVQDIFLSGRLIDRNNFDISKRLNRYLLYGAVLNNDSSIADGKCIGDPTESCLLYMARKVGLDKLGITEEELRAMMIRLEELPFDSDRKLMSTKYKVHGVPTIFTKGAVDVILRRTKNIATYDEIRPITQEDRELILNQNDIFSENGLRVLAFAYKECRAEEALTVDAENDYTFIGLVSIIDPPREESADAVNDAINAGIKPIMITGDHLTTATAIARQIGIYKEGDMAVTGMWLDDIDDEKLNGVLENISVYARVSPENKIRIVDLWQKKGKVVAMTGDGVNDAPALKKADIGVAMGITGTEVSKDAAAMILADDNFATIIKAVLNGRNVYRNIINSIMFLLSGNMAAIIAVLYCSVMALAMPFEPVHLLFINLLTDSLPALAIGMEPSDRKLLSDKPRNPKTGILTKKFTLKLLIYGAVIGTSTIVAYHIGLRTDAVTAGTMAFATLTLARLFHGFTCRSNYSIFNIGFKNNLWSIAAFFIGALLLGLVLFIPAARGLFMTSRLDAWQLICVALLSFAPTFFIQLIRIIKEWTVGHR